VKEFRAKCFTNPADSITVKEWDSKQLIVQCWRDGCAPGHAHSVVFSPRDEARLLRALKRRALNRKMGRP